MQQVKKILQIAKNKEQKTVLLQYMLINDITRQLWYFEEIAQNLQSLSLHGNKLKFLPNMSMFVQLKELDISNNPIKIDDHLLDSLYSIPKLRSLHIDAKPQELIRISESIPTLQFLNRKDIIRYRKIIEDDSKKIQRIKQLKDQIDNFRSTFVKLPQLFQNQDQTSPPVKLSQRQYNYFTDQLIQQYTKFDADVNHENVKEGVKIYSSNKIMNIIDDEILDLLQQNGVGHSGVNLIQKLNQKKTKNFEAMLRIILQMGYADYVKDQISNPQNIRIRKENLYLQQISRLKKEVNTLKNQLVEVTKLNDKYVKQIHDKVDKRSISRSASRSITPINRNNGTPMKKNQSQFNLNLLTPSASRNNLNKKLTTQKSQRNLSPKPSSKMLNSSVQTNRKLLRLQQILPLIKQIMNKKAQFNKQCVSKKQAFQTMEQFLFTFFFRKYGLKDIALKWSLTMLKNIEAFSKTNTLVYCFGSILKNRMQQNFYEKQVAFQSIVKQTIKAQQRRKVISQQFSKDEVRKLISKILVVDEETMKSIQELQFPCQHSSVQYAISKLNIDLHEKQLLRITNLFMKEDRDGDGIITRQSVATLIEKYNQEQQQKNFQFSAKQLLNKIDPFKTNKILFSVLVSAIQQRS